MLPRLSRMDNSEYMEFRLQKMNYYLKDAKAFTEDDVLIFNVYLYRVPNNVLAEDVKKYFGKYGPVVKVFLMKSRLYKNKHYKTGFVNFSNPYAPARALEVKRHFFYGQIIGIKACDSWHQPTLRQYEENVDYTPWLRKLTDPPTNMNFFLSQLNDDSLRKILEYLPIKDQVRLGLTSIRFLTIFKLTCKNSYSNIDLNLIKDMTILESRELFSACGENLKSITGSIHSENQIRAARALGDYSGQINKVDLYHTTIKTQLLYRILDRMPFLSNLVLKNCFLIDQDIFVLTQLYKLQKLNLASNYQISGKHLSLFKNITEMNVSNCFSLKPSSFQKICRELKRLRILDVRLCHLLRPIDFERMTEHCRHLELLYIAGVAQGLQTNIREMPSIHKLEVDSETKVHLQLFLSLADVQIHRSEALFNTIYNTYIERLWLKTRDVRKPFGELVKKTRNNK